MLRHFVMYKQNNWVELLHLVEFAYNSSKNSSTGLTPFQADIGRTPDSVLEILHPTDDRVHQVELLHKQFKDTNKLVHEALQKGQIQMKKQAFKWKRCNDN